MYLHQLTEFSEVEVEGEPEPIETMNSWGFASMLVDVWISDRLPQVQTMLVDCLKTSGIPNLDIPSIIADRHITEPRRMELINWVEAGITAKLQQAFEKP